MSSASPSPTAKSASSAGATAQSASADAASRSPIASARSGICASASPPGTRINGATLVLKRQDQVAAIAITGRRIDGRTHAPRASFGRFGPVAKRLGGPRATDDSKNQAPGTPRPCRLIRARHRNRRELLIIPERTAAPVGRSRWGRRPTARRAGAFEPPRGRRSRSIGTRRAARCGLSCWPRGRPVLASA